MSIKAKFYVESVRETGYCGTKNPGREVELAPVTGGESASEEDRSFAAATPGGKITLFVDNPDCADAFKPGDAYYVTFDLAPAD